MQGQLLKRSRWIGRWNEREAEASSEEGVSCITWTGGRQPGSVAIDHATDVIISGEVLIVRTGWFTSLRFRAAPGGPDGAIVSNQTPRVWLEAIESGTHLLARKSRWHGSAGLSA